jgi:hypothetical protein
MTVSPAPAGWAVLAAGAALVAGCNDSVATVAQPPGGDLTISAFIRTTAANQPCVPAGSTKQVIVRATAVAFTGAGGRSSVTLQTLQMPETSTAGEPDIENGSVVFGCDSRGTFGNLRPGTWSVSLSGAVSGTCPKTIVTSGQRTKVRIENNSCGDGF